MKGRKVLHGWPLLFQLRSFPRNAVRKRPPDRQAFAQRLQDAHLQLVGGCELLDQLIADIAMLGIGFAVLREKFDVMRLESIMVAESAKELAAGQLIGKFVAAVGRCHLLQDMITSEGDFEPADARQNRGRQEILLGLAALQLFGGDPDAFAETQKQCAVPQHRPRLALEIGVTDFRMYDVDEFLVDGWIVNSGKLAPHQFRGVYRDIIRKNPPRFLGPDLDRRKRQPSLIEIEIKWVM